MTNLIKQIIVGKDINIVFNYVLDQLYKKGPVSVSDMEVLSYLQLYHPDYFGNYKDSILNFMGVFYKNTERNSLKDVVFTQYKRHLKEVYNHNYTPVQASIVKGINSNNCFSFSAPTSTGKSYVFMNQILSTSNDVVVVVPSRALINEYFLKLNNLIQEKSVNVLTFIDSINTLRAKRNVFIVTPERCRELFKQKEKFNVELFLFDEAQLSNEDSKRGLYFDSIVRRCYKAYPSSKFVFAHPFVKNPESQIEKNHFNKETANSIQYTQKNVGQLFLTTDDDWNFFHFGIDKTIMGTKKQKCEFDPIEKTIKEGGSVLLYVSKSKIYNKSFLNDFSKYIDLCNEINNDRIESYIEQLKEFTGGDTIANKNHFSQMLSLLKRGIVIHHGSLPLQTRVIIEEFTKEGLCRICFATSTLEQGINMPFDVVFLDRLEGSKPLSVKNLIGRAGRSTLESKFDFGYVIVSNPSRMTVLRNIINQDEELDNVSALEKNEQHDDDYNDFKEAILNDTFSDEFNLTEKDIAKLTSIEIDEVIEGILKAIFIRGTLIPLDEINSDSANRLDLYTRFQNLYSVYLGRALERGEQNVFNTAIKIILWRVYGRTFKNICWYRYSYASKSRERLTLERAGRSTDHIEASFYTEFKDLPDKKINVYSYLNGVKAKDVDYDFIMYDTYDYIDKLIGFKLSDVFYTALYKYYEKTNNPESLSLAKFIKFGTENERHIWMLRYGLSFEDIELLDNHIESITSEAIVFKESINRVPEINKFSVLRFLS
ncbi:DEAD/DEAH box helicase [Algoriphagus sp. A40]|uniref:DEAD/DEAH box helicase n=1 Tax=Algoriphagus sp. A40 TaxID=1945863 RepID=UPI000986A61D|nr:DEAD/DEAH box helicase [Algoriphagus sp. A40]OOG77487.1 helicase [Algoriphagus sp. A40]